MIFDSRALVGYGQDAVYVSAVAEELTGADLDRGIAIFSCRSETHGAGERNPEDVSPLAIACTGSPPQSTQCSASRTGGRR